MTSIKIQYESSAEVDKASLDEIEPVVARRRIVTSIPGRRLYPSPGWKLSLNTDYGASLSGSRGLDLGSNILKPGAQILDPGSWMQQAELDPASCIQPRPHVQEQGCWIQELEGRCLGLGSRIEDPGP